MRNYIPDKSEIPEDIYDSIDINEEYGTIYLYINIITFDKYVGQTIDKKNDGFRSTFSLLGLKCYNNIFYNDLKKYGINNFKRIIIDTAEDQQELNYKEHLWIYSLVTLFPFGYNKVPIKGGGARLRTSFKYDWIDDDWFFDQYVVKQQFTYQIAKTLNTTKKVIEDELLRRNYTIRDDKERIKKIIKSENSIRQKNRWKNISKEERLEFGKKVSNGFKNKTKKECNDFFENHKKYNISKEKLIELYWINKEYMIQRYLHPNQISALQIGKLYNTRSAIIIYHLKHYKILIRTQSESNKLSFLSRRNKQIIKQSILDVFV